VDCPFPKYPQLKLGLPSKKASSKLGAKNVLTWCTSPQKAHWVGQRLQAATLLRLPVTSDFRTNFHSYSKHYGVGWLSKPIVAYLRKFHNRTACTMVPTQSLKLQLEASGFQNLRVIARGVDTQLFHPTKRSQTLRESWKVGPEDLVLLSVGRLAVEKNLDLIVNTYTSLLQSGRKVKLVFAGDGPYRAQLQTQCPEAIFTGMCSHAELATVYASSDLFLFPSLTETFGNVTLEALACGTPVLAFDCAAAGEWVIEGQNGWLIHGEDAQRYVLKALEICKNKNTLEKARAYTASSVANLDWHAIADQVEHIFRETLDASQIKAHTS
jgi:glycosyltransferase involved in cell wall biosynthesis